jgi:hypothetical protein
VKAAAGTLSIKPEVKSLKGAMASDEHLQARIANTYINFRNLINTIQKPTAVHAVVEVLQNMSNLLINYVTD